MNTSASTTVSVLCVSIELQSDMEWRDIPGFEGYYQVSDDGDVRSVKRTIYNSKGYFATRESHVLCPNQNKCGYLKVILCVENKHYTRMVHQLVAMAFLGHTLNGHKLTINHKDGNKHNNCIANLEIVSMTTNRRHAIMLGLWNQRGTQSVRAKLTSDDLAEIRARYAKGGVTHKELAEMFNVSKKTIGKVIRRQRCD